MLVSYPDRFCPAGANDLPYTLVTVTFKTRFHLEHPEYYGKQFSDEKLQSKELPEQNVNVNYPKPEPDNQPLPRRSARLARKPR